MIFEYFVLAVALLISATSAYYSIIGLTAIFAAAFWSIVIMGTVLELGKIAASLWLKKYWHQAGWQLKYYLVSAVGVLMVITSLGIFGGLSKAHLDQAVPLGDVAATVAQLDERIQTERSNIESAQRALQQMDAQVDQRLSRSDDAGGAERAVQIRRGQARERAKLQQDIATAQQTIVALNKERAPIASELREVEAKVGPIKYVAALIYGDNPDTNLLERAVRWIIIVIVLVFDPLAIALLLAATSSMRWNAREQQAEPNQLPEAPAAGPTSAASPQVDESTESIRMVNPPPAAVNAEPDIQLNLGLTADNEPALPIVSRFGTQFPPAPSLHETFLKVDSLPARLYKFNGRIWKEISRNEVDQYRYDDQYIDFLISQLESGKYDANLLTDSERAQIAQRLKQ